MNAKFGARGPKIAVACSGLGHIHRGVETWAADLSQALRRRGVDVTLFQGAGPAAEPWQKTVPCIRRFSAKAARLESQFKRLSGWRYGLGSGYQIEQTSFAWNLWPRIRRDYDIVHTQDPLIGLTLERLHRLRISRPRVVLAHGTEESPETLRRFTYLQHLAPVYHEAFEPGRPARMSTFAIGNFVNTDLFRPGDRRAARAEWDIPQDGLVVLCVAAIKNHHKRIDSLIREFAACARGDSPPATLVVAGGREAETDEVIALGRRLLGDRVRFFEGVPRAKMAGLCRAADVFALASLHEMMPIAVLEAIATGLPIVCNDTPTLHWMTGPAGLLADLREEGAMAAQLTRLFDPAVRAQFACAARAHAEANFSEAVVTDQILAMYESIAVSPRRRIGTGEQ